MDCSLPGSSVRGISQAGIVESVTFPSWEDLPDPGVELSFFVVPALAGEFFTIEPPGKTHSVINFLINTSVSQAWY